MGTISHNQVCDFFSDLESASSVEDAWLKTCQIADETGTRNIAIRRGLKAETPLFLCTAPDWVRKMYLETVYPDNDPKITHCKRSTTPLLYGREFWNNHDRISSARRTFDEEIVHAGFRSLIAVPAISHPCGETGLVAWAFDLPRSKFSRFYDEIGAALHLISLASYERIAALSRRDEKKIVSLSNRETECLEWLALGYRFGQIADKLGIKRVTVEFHLSNARRKLGVRSREQAVARATMLGLISI